MNYSDKLKRLIARKGLTHQQAADLFGCKQHVMTRYINGRKPGNPERFKKLAEFFDVSVDVLMDDSIPLPGSSDISDDLDVSGTIASLLLIADIENLRVQAAVLRKTAADLELMAAKMEGRK